jgi:hypothetical protein
LASLKLKVGDGPAWHNTIQDFSAGRRLLSARFGGRREEKGRQWIDYFPNNGLVISPMN